MTAKIEKTKKLARNELCKARGIFKSSKRKIKKYEMQVRQGSENVLKQEFIKHK